MVNNPYLTFVTLDTGVYTYLEFERCAGYENDFTISCIKNRQNLKFEAIYVKSC